MAFLFIAASEFDLKGLFLTLSIKVQIMSGVNKLSLEKRIQILSMLCEGSSMRAISRIADVSINTVTKMLVDAGEACAKFHDENVRGVKSKNVQCDEIWSFCYAKAKNVATAKTEKTRTIWSAQFKLRQCRNNYMLQCANDCI